MHPKAFSRIKVLLGFLFGISSIWCLVVLFQYNVSDPNEKILNALRTNSGELSRKFDGAARDSAELSRKLDLAISGVQVMQHVVAEKRYSGCKNSRKDSNGLICIDDRAWDRILREDDAAWARMNASLAKERHMDGSYMRHGYERTESSRVKYREKRRDYLMSMWVPTLSCPEEMKKNVTCDTVIFDPNADMVHWRVPKMKNINLYPLGIAKEGEAGGKYKSYDELLEKFGHKKSHVDILKIDVEGAELKVIPNILARPKELLPGQILIEMHLPRYPQVGAKEGDEVLVGLRKAGYSMFHTEANYDDPQNCNEYSFILLVSRTYLEA